MQLKFLILFALAAFVAAQNTDIKTVTDDLEGLKTIGTNLKTAIENADPNSVPDDLKLQGEFDTAKDSVEKATADVLNAAEPIDDVNAKTIVGLIEDIVNILIEAFKELGDKAPDYPFWARPIICEDLTSLNSTTVPLVQAFINKSPDQYKDQTAQLKGEVQVAFAGVTKAYC